MAFSMRIDIVDTTAFITLSGKLDSETGPQLLEQLKQLDEIRITRLVVLMDKLEYIDSYGLGVLLVVRRKESQDIRVYLIGISEEVRAVMPLTDYVILRGVEYESYDTARRQDATLPPRALQPYEIKTPQVVDRDLPSYEIKTPQIVDRDLPQAIFEEGVRLKARRRRRVVNTGFAPQTDPDDEIDPMTPLRVSDRYYFWLDIGSPRKKSMEETPTDIPPVSAQARLIVTVCGFSDGIEVTPGADVGELEVQGTGTVHVIRQPLADALPQSRRLRRRLFFPVCMPGEVGTYRMRCNIYWGQILLQSRVISARVTARPEPNVQGEKALGSVLDYTISQALDPTYLTQLAEHRLSIFLNNNGDSTHSFHLFGIDGQQRFKQDDVRFGEGELQGMIAQARGTLRIASWGNEREWPGEKAAQEGVAYRYKDRQRNLARLEKDLTLLAKWGYEFYDKAVARFAGGEDIVEAFEQFMLEPGAIQIAMKEAPSYILPAALIYDYPLDIGAKRFSFCPAFEEAFNRAESLENVECFKGRCQTRKDGNLTVICPSGFWGFRHYLGMPLSVKKEDAPANIIVQQNMRMAMSADPGLQFLEAHQQVLRDLRPGLDWRYAETRDEVFSVLKESPHVVYFYCHGGLVRDAPFLQVGPKEDPGLIQRSNFRSYKIVWDAPRPLVFINGCHTTAVEPLQALNFIDPLVTYSKGAGVIGTEITIFEELATVFAEECFRRLFAGASIGAAIRGARLTLLGDGNPLGLVYIPFVMAGLKLVNQ